MQGIREYNRKIASLKNTRKITSSMKMISSVKLQRFSRVRTDALPFWKESARLQARVSSLVTNRPTSTRSAEDGPVALVVLVTSDRGMCGQHNNNAIREAMTLYDTLSQRGLKVRFSVAGNRGTAFFRRRNIPVEHDYSGASSAADYEEARAIAYDCMASFERGEADEVWLVYTLRVSSLDQRPTTERLLPLAPADDVVDREAGVLLEETPEELLQTVEPLVVRARVHRALVESAVSEHEARMAAMESATSNCDRLIHHYVQLRNRARQAAITTELSEIVTGKEAIEQ